ncbi:RNA deprotection pyrophosphohydrolase [Lentibacillus cibarius]|uniref:Nucleoside triphosphatase YtkD n=1 Tax=Lentibacillus cibarius TaxID=2583219 RepID=A0A5S3QSV0_9BACI|nr:nucleoside triphosphatase YtkD [Lentibacillus cibarius]TMN23766.1 nucleoside triphosphatase YtkD [Lentibacillus cibarius]
MYIFKDFYRNEVKLSFNDHPFSKDPKHVLVICTHKNKWLLTKHKDRGLEFPGGKVEENEGARDAAIREVREETGGVIDSIRYIGQYVVAGKGGTIVKNVYAAEINALLPQTTYYETDGPILLDALPGDIKYRKSYSFIMKDDVLKHCLDYLEKIK